MIERDIYHVAGRDILDVHELKVTQHSSDYISMSVHIRSRYPMKTLALVTNLCRKKYGIYDLTVQMEGPFDKSQNKHAFQC